MNRQQRQAEERLHHFSELLSQDIPLAVIAQRMGIRTPRASQLLMKVRERLGPQAV